MRMKALMMVLAMGLLGVMTPAQAQLIDRGNGLIYDTVLDITWLQDANYAMTSGYDDDGSMTWWEATLWADQLVYQGLDDWRLAAVSVSAGIPTGELETYTDLVDCFADSEEQCRDNELGYMFRYNLGGVLGDDFRGDWVSVDGVELYNIQFGYHSATAFIDFNEDFIYFFGGGGLLLDYMGSHWAAWAVRDGDIDEVQCAIPYPPDGLQATVQDRVLRLTWDESEHATRYDVYRSINGAEFILVDRTDETFYEFALPWDARVVDLYVIAVSTCGQSAASATLQVLLGKSGRKPPRP